ncbi:MAG: hypothetical protein GTO41_05000, partial [Burkholderiales bacterium]|nr:hypothetical protein [Burkholderiales bacterium]
CRLVSKRRDTFFLEWRDVPTTLCLDWVEPLGHFVELELVVEPSQVGQAQQNVQSLAARLGLGESIIKSYLQMIEELPER